MAGENDKWEIYQDKGGKYRWRRKATNGNIVGSSCQGYKGRSSAKSNAQRHGMDGNPDKLGKDDKWEMYKDKKGEHRWRRTSKNGEIVGSASEGYSSKSACTSNAERNGM